MKVRRIIVPLLLVVAFIFAEFAFAFTTPFDDMFGVSEAYAGGKYVKCKKMYKQINKFRRKKKQWEWKKGSKKKKYYNTKKSNKLKKLKRDKSLEKTAKRRAKELKKFFAHERPNGSSCFSIYPKKFRYMGENIAMGQETVKQVMKDWEEEDYKYNGQGHRRNMLNKHFKKVGVACFEYKGYRYWVQCFGG